MLYIVFLSRLSFDGLDFFCFSEVRILFVGRHPQKRSFFFRPVGKGAGGG